MAGARFSNQLRKLHAIWMTWKWVLGWLLETISLTIYIITSRMNKFRAALEHNWSCFVIILRIITYSLTEVGSIFDYFLIVPHQ